MLDIFRNHSSEGQTRKAWLFALVLISYITLTMYFGNQGEVDEESILQISPLFLLVAQGIFSILMFVGVSLLFIKVVLKFSPSEFFPKVSWSMVGITCLVSISFMVVNSAIGEWNLNLDFPDSDFEDWAKQSEEQLKVLTEHVVNFTSLTHFIIAFVVVGIIPAIGEELLFRGLIQNFLTKAFSNHHLGIWISGFAFAAIHMQFYGLAPRMLLGVVFGYLYHWSGNLTVAMIAHLINNGLALFLLYMSTLGAIEVSPEQMESSAPWPIVVVFAVVCVISLRIFYQKYSQTNG
ncbi:MAG: CPBP family intramembrane glutamic endopeptidase [Cyclobacteriaceae bacterium]